MNKEIRPPCTEMEYKILPSYYCIYSRAVVKKFCVLILDSFFVQNREVYEIRERDTNISWTKDGNVIDFSYLGVGTSLYSAYLLEYGMSVSKECIRMRRSMVST